MILKFCTKDPNRHKQKCWWRYWKSQTSVESEINGQWSAEAVSSGAIVQAAFGLPNPLGAQFDGRTAATTIMAPSWSWSNLGVLVAQNCGKQRTKRRRAFVDLFEAQCCAVKDAFPGYPGRCDKALLMASLACLFCSVRLAITCLPHAASDSMRSLNLQTLELKWRCLWSAQRCAPRLSITFDWHAFRCSKCRQLSD